MSLFQKTVIAKYTSAIDKTILDQKWALFSNYFQDLAIQKNIRKGNEEQFQEGFLRELFVNVFGYTLNPSTDYNLITEQKNVSNSKKADGAILVNKKVVGVIELKGTATTDLGKIETQAFGYKNNQQNCTYVITSNFEKLRFYIDNAVEHLEFNLFTLTKKEFELLYLVLEYTNLKKDLAKKIKKESISEENKVTKELYKDYSTFKRELHKNLVALNPKYDALLLFKKSQKLLDRFLFLFFAEDRALLPPNSVRLVLNDWDDLVERDAEVPLYSRFKKYFGYLNTGFKGKRYDVYPYNGGLFKPDAVLDAVKIEDTLLYNHTKKLSEYDFESEVDVNILGHIFENSLNEIEEVQATLEGQTIDKTNTKRKKDGVFYTPKYITKYIVKNTVGKLCTEKKAILKITDEAYKPAKQRSRKKIETLQNYRDWLLHLTICDPACGSGAFLNEALNFLIAEHKYIDELSAKYNKDTLTLSDVEKSILENNLFGVDLNNESVEIAKLSLWLRTARPNRKLNDLNNNIKCGNSLIDDATIAGEKAFNWQKEFPQVFKEKQEKIYHITTSIHDSRTSARMEKYNVRALREEGTNPYPNVVYFTPEDDLLITKTIATITKKETLTLLAYNICADHIHLVLRCEEEQIPKIMQKIKGRTSFEHRKSKIPRDFSPLKKEVDNSNTRGSSPLENVETKTKKKPLWSQKYYCKEIVNADQLTLTVDYVKKNRSKHQLPEHNSELKNIINSFCTPIDKAFEPKYNSGFDVIIGNPPYVRQELLNTIEKKWLSNNYETGNGTADLYVYFYEKSINILKPKGYLGFITPNKFYKTKYGKELRGYLNNYEIKDLIDFFELKVFEDASTDSQILILRKHNSKKTINYAPIDTITSFRDNLYKTVKIDALNLKTEIWIFNNKVETLVLDKMLKNSISLKDYTKNGIKLGVKTACNKAFIITDKIKQQLINENQKSADLIKPYANATDIKGWYLQNEGKYHLINTGFDIDINNKEYSAIKNHLNLFYVDLKSRTDKGKTPYNLRACSYYDSFEKPKIMYIYTAVKHNFYYDTSGTYVNNSCFIIENGDKFLSCILNSKSFNFYKKLNFVAYGNANSSGRNKLDLNKMNLVPIPKTSKENQQPFIQKADIMLSLNKELQEVSSKFTRTLFRKFETLDKLSKKLESWYSLAFADFIKELKKKKIKLSLSEEADWEDYFLTEQTRAKALEYQINTQDILINKMVYELYDLTDEEIAIVENS